MLSRDGHVLARRIEGYGVTLIDFLDRDLRAL